jgi:hypothetical protein
MKTYCFIITLGRMKAGRAYPLVKLSSQYGHTLCRLHFTTMTY